LSYGNEIDPCKSLQEHYDSVIRQHDAIINFIKERDETRLKETVCDHIEIFKNRIIQYLAS
jgi:DNA-binding FadR family transcriptional regulator